MFNIARLMRPLVLLSCPTRAVTWKPLDALSVSAFNVRYFLVAALVVALMQPI